MKAGERRKINRGEQIENKARGKRGCDIVRRCSRSVSGTGREQRRAALHYGRRKHVARQQRKRNWLSRMINPAAMVGQRSKENDHKYSKRSREKG